MFNLEKSIAEWRKQMLAAGIKSPVPLEELEIHLREEVEQQMQSGLIARQAFNIAVERIGHFSVLKSEFAKAGGTPGARQWKFMRTGCHVPAVIFALVGTCHFVTQGMSLEERMPGFATVALITLYLSSLPCIYGFFSAIRNLRVRMIIEIASTFAWLGCGAFILENLAVNSIAVALWAMMSAVAVLVWIPRLVAYDAGTPPPRGPVQSIPPGPRPPRTLPPEVCDPVQPFRRQFTSPQLMPS